MGHLYTGTNPRISKPTMSTQNFKAVKFSSVRKFCPLPLAVTVGQRDVSFRLSAELVDEAKVKSGDLYAIFYDDGPALFALVADPKNGTGEARKFLAGSGKKKPKHGRTLKITFPRTDLLARIWKEAAPIKGLPLFEKRGPGKLVFHAPSEKVEVKS